MYHYNEFDKTIVRERAAQYRGQLERHLAGTLIDDEFRPLRLQNGWYIQRHAPMLRIAVPYGVISSAQLTQMAHIAREFDHGYAHFTTRQNVQFNWIALERSADVMDLLADVDMHGIQTSGNCIRNITTDSFAGVASDEVIDPRPFCELLRQWSTFHPEFAYLPRKFKIAVSGALEDRAKIAWHDIGLQLLRNAAGTIGFKVLAGGGMGRTPVIGTVIAEFVPWQQILNYCEAILRVYNQHGRRDNMYKARIKILVKALGPAFAEQVEAEFAHVKQRAPALTDAMLASFTSHFEQSAFYPKTPAIDFAVTDLTHPGFARWRKRCVHAHRHVGYAAVTLSFKRAGTAPGDITDAELDAVAALAQRYSHAEARVTHQQNLVLPHVAQRDLLALWLEAKLLGLASPNIGLLSDLICCPGGDFCSLANAKSIPIAEAIWQRFDDEDYLHDLGELHLNISGCINSCGHHHAGHIGILGVDKDGSEWYQVTLGGTGGDLLGGGVAKTGKVIGRSFAADEMPDVIARLLHTYVAERIEGERFIDTVQRTGLEPFKTHVYATAASPAAVPEKELA